VHLAEQLNRRTGQPKQPTMAKHNENNERVKREYFAYLKEVQRHSEHSVDANAMAQSSSPMKEMYREKPARISCFAHFARSVRSRSRS
jgi:hypothetical protein